jgi:hypothetical protein
MNTDPSLVASLQEASTAQITTAPYEIRSGFTTRAQRDPEKILVEETLLKGAPPTARSERQRLEITETLSLQAFSLIPLALTKSASKT